MGTLIITDGIFNNFAKLDDIDFSGNLYIYDAKFTPTPILRNPTDRNKIEEYFIENYKGEDVEIELISFNRNDEAIINCTKIYIFTTKIEEKIDIEFINYVNKLNKTKPEIVFSVRKRFFIEKRDVKTISSELKNMGLENKNDKVYKKSREKINKMKKRAASSKKKDDLKSLILEGSPFVMANK